MQISNVEQALLSGILSFAAGAFSSLGLYKYYVEPIQVGAALRKKYGAALWIAAKELQVHLARIQDTLNDDKVFNSLLKIPVNDWNQAPDWFTKNGFYTMATAHKIATLSAWLYVYQQEMLFSPTKASGELLSEIYGVASIIRRAFSESSCLWPEYFDAIGSEYLERVGDSYRPLSFSRFCLRCGADQAFLKFFDQLHNFVHLTVKDERRGRKGRIGRIQEALNELMGLLERKKLLVGLQKERIGKDISSRSVLPDET